MLFRSRFHPGLADGSITLTFRQWASPRVKVGGRYRCGSIGLLEVLAIDRVRAGDVTRSEARRAGFEDVAELLAYLSEVSPRRLDRRSALYRVELRFAGPDERTSAADDPALSDDDFAKLRSRLEKMDRMSRHGAWTGRALSLIEKNPRVAASRLAASVGRETRAFKADVRKLKRLGLTLSFDVGYELSPRGRTFLARMRS